MRTPGQSLDILGFPDLGTIQIIRVFSFQADKLTAVRGCLPEAGLVVVGGVVREIGVAHGCCFVVEGCLGTRQ